MVDLPENMIEEYNLRDKFEAFGRTVAQEWTPPKHVQFWIMDTCHPPKIFFFGNK